MPIETFHCAYCGSSVERHTSNGSALHFCGIPCKARWQREQHPVSNEWLRAKYVDDKLSANAIALLVHRDPKSVWTWLRMAGIETRRRGVASSENAWKPGQRSAFAGHTHTQENKDAQRARRMADGRVPYMKNGAHHMKGVRGAKHPRWKGGLTPERVAFYSTPEWKTACVIVWKRDDAKCRRCAADHRTLPKEKRGTFHVHHIVSFMVRELRAEPTNLVLLCAGCHRWVHSKKNTERSFLK